MGAMGTGLRLFIAGGGLGGGHFYEALQECLRSPSDQNFCRVLRLEVGRLARADVGHLQDEDTSQLAGGSGEQAQQGQEGSGEHRKLECQRRTK